MNAAIKIIVGLVLILVGLGLFVDELTPIVSQYKGIPTIMWLTNFIIVVTGVIPIFLILVGLFVVWLEADELKASKELKPKQASPAPEVKKVEEVAKEPAKKK